MPLRKYSGYSLSDVNIPTTTETVVASVAGVSTNQANQQVSLRCFMQLTIGTGTTGLTIRIRRDSVTGTVVGEANLETVAGAAGSTEDHTIECEDLTVGETIGRTYVCTVQQTGATGNGTAVQTEMVAEVSP